jgi:hypothetical protein
MPPTTPLLLLLDSFLSHDDEQIHDTISQVEELLKSSKRCSNLNTGSDQALNFAGNIVYDLLETFPNLASVASAQDGSLPLHFAASLGDVNIASVIYHKVNNIFN